MAVENTPVGVANLTGAIDLGKQVLKSLELANGGAVIAILTFYGNVVKDGARTPIDPSLLALGLYWFAAGLALAITAASLAYLGQFIEATATPAVTGVNLQAEAQAEAAQARFGVTLRWLAIVAALLSLAAFVTGTYSAGRSFSAAPADPTRWRVSSHIGSEWTFSRKAFEETPARRVTAVCTTYHWAGHEPVLGEDACALAVGRGLVEPLQKLAIPKSPTARLPMIDFLEGGFISVAEGDGSDRIMQLFKVNRDEVVP
jgi:hypothetical protein